ncbi:unnamed protein product [Lactuca saligna]|uniref:TF-B3 domain-containing protein n=1 Tax=Lactuca saligna TaxID=75948 RepID=A0AA36E0V2_LACSI|nr:unnamed protein product [Lactuca saligna]
MAQDATGSNKRVHSALLGYEDDDTDEYYLNVGEDENEEEDEAQKEYYRKKIMELYEEKMKKFAREDALAEQIKCEESKKLCKHPTKKIKMQQPKPTTQIVSNQVTQQLKQFITNNEMNAVEETKRSKSTPTLEKNKKVEIVKNQITQELEEFITNKLKGKEAKVVMEKTLYKSDLEKNQNRLNMPMKQVIEPDEFLRKNEKDDLENGKEFEVKLWGPRLKKHEKRMMLKMWHMKSTSNYVLKTNWNHFVMANKKDLEINKKIQVWSFRRKEKLCFAIARLDRDVDSQNDAT